MLSPEKYKGALANTYPERSEGKVCIAHSVVQERLLQIAKTVLLFAICTLLYAIRCAQPAARAFI